MPTREEYKARQEELQAKLPSFLQTLQDLPDIHTVYIGFHDDNDTSLENMGYIVQLHKDVDLTRALTAVAYPRAFQGERVKIRVDPDPQPEGSGTRPIKGGVKAAVVSTHSGTLGGVAKRISDGKAVLVSNHHVFYGHGKGDGDTVYQPSTSCCNSYAVGTNVLGIDGTVDAAIAEASVAVTNDVVDIGTIVGIEAPVCGEIIRKTGAKTGTTTGVINAVNANPSSTRYAIEVVPTAGESAFTQGGDSGSYYVNENMNVVGLHNSGDVEDGIKKSWGADINNVVAQMGITIPNPDLTSADVDMAAILGAPPPPPDISKYEAEANKSVNGRAALQVIKQFADEVRQLVHHNRAVTVVWIDNKGPEFGEAWQIGQTNPTAKLPKSVEGVTIQTLITNMSDILCQKGSPDLASAIHTYQPAILAAVDKLDSVQDLTDFANGDQIHCFAVTFLWTLMWDAGTEFYLPTIAKKGLQDAKLGIDIKPFATIKVGDIPQVTMFDEPVLGYMKLDMTDTEISGIDTISGSGLSCTDNGDGSTTMSFKLGFKQLTFSGNYGVSAGGGIGGCAIAGAAAVLGGGSLLDELAGSGIPGQAGVDQAMWYRGPLGDSSNGRVLIGSYYANQDAILDLQQEGGGQNAYMQSLKASDVTSTTDAVSKATTYYQKQETGMLTEVEDAAAPPTIGADDQYNAGQLPYAYLIAMARKKVRDGQDPDGRFAALAQDATGFVHTISWYKSTYPGEQPIGGQDGVLSRIAAADPEEVRAFVLAQPPVSVIDPTTGQVVEEVCATSFDTRRAFKAFQRHVALIEDDGAVGGSDVTGKFADQGVDISLHLTMTLSGNMKSDPQVDITKLVGSVGQIKITLSDSGGWWPGLFDKVSNWIANSDFFIDIIRSQIQREMQGDVVRDALSDLLEGAMKKLG